MYVPERPIVHPGGAQVFQRGRGVVLGAFVTTDVGVQHRHRQRIAPRPLEPRGEVGRLGRPRVPLAVARTRKRAFAVELEPLRGPRREVVDGVGQHQIARTRRLRIVIALGDVHRDAGVGEPLGLLLEAQLRRKVARVVVDVPGDDEEVDVLREAQIDDAPERLSGRGDQRGPDARIRRIDARERSVEVQVGSVHKSHRSHPGPSHWMWWTSTAIVSHPTDTARHPARSEASDQACGEFLCRSSRHS